VALDPRAEWLSAALDERREVADRNGNTHTRRSNRSAKAANGKGKGDQKVGALAAAQQPVAVYQVFRPRSLGARQRTAFG